MSLASTALTDLGTLLRSMHPTLNEGVYVFVSVPSATDCSLLQPLAVFREPEGITLILREAEAARANLVPLFRAAWITLEVHSDLQAVGFTAAFAAALSKARISCNVVAAVNHDHLFVPIAQSDDALAVLQAMQSEAENDAIGSTMLQNQTASMRKLVSSGSPLEPQIGFSRAVRVGNQLAISGTAPIAANGSVAAPGDVYGQTKRCLDIIQQAIADAGLTLQSVIRTRVMLTDMSRWQEAARAHGELFCDIKPACTFVEVKGFIDPDWLVELEADCVA